MNEAAMNILVQVFLGGHIFPSPYPEMGWMGHIVGMFGVQRN